MSFAHAYVAVRTIDTSIFDPDANPHRTGGPQLPGTWRVVRQGLTGWWMVTHPSGDEMAVFRINSLGTEALWVALGPQDRLEALAAERPDAMPAAELSRRRAETTVEAGAVYSPRQMARGYRVWECDVIEDDGDGPVLKTNVVRVLVDEGVLVPGVLLDGTPTVLGPRTVNVLHQPALHVVGGGRGDDFVVENEPDRGP